MKNYIIAIITCMSLSITYNISSADTSKKGKSPLEIYPQTAKVSITNKTNDTLLVFVSPRYFSFSYLLPYNPSAPAPQLQEEQIKQFMQVNKYDIEKMKKVATENQVVLSKLSPDLTVDIFTYFNPRFGELRSSERSIVLYNTTTQDLYTLSLRIEAPRLMSPVWQGLPIPVNSAPSMSLWTTIEGTDGFRDYARSAVYDVNWEQKEPWIHYVVNLKIHDPMRNSIIDVVGKVFSHPKDKKISEDVNLKDTFLDQLFSTP